MAQYVALAASFIGVLAGGNYNPSNKQQHHSSSSDTQHSKSLSILPGDTTLSFPLHGRSFSLGIISGMSLGIILVAQCSNKRIRKRIHNTFKNMIRNHGYFYYSKTSTNETSCCGDDSTTPTSSTNCAIDGATNENDSTSLIYHPKPSKFIQGNGLGEHSKLQILVDTIRSDTITSTLYSVIITLKAGTGMIPQLSNGVEVYYVLRGSGMFIKDGKSFPMGVDDVVVVNPWISRAMKNDGYDDLVFIRTSDSGNNDNNQKDFDVVVRNDNNNSFFITSNALDVLSSSLKAVSGWFDSTPVNTGQTVQKV